MLVVRDTGPIHPVELAEAIWQCDFVRDVQVDQSGTVSFDCFGGREGIQAAMNYFSGSGLAITVE